jgi:hypothetical protein
MENLFGDNFSTLSWAVFILSVQCMSDINAEIFGTLAQPSFCLLTFLQTFKMTI